MRKKESGIALVVTTAILMLLSILAVGFVKMALLERKIATHGAEKSQAFLAAQAGIEYALLVIPLQAFKAAYSDPKSEYQFNESVEVPVTQSQEPSFKKTKHPVGEFFFSLEAVPGVAYSTLKIIDANALFNLNSPIDGGYRRILKRLLYYVLGMDSSAAGNVVSSIEARRNGVGEYRVPHDARHLVDEGLLSGEQFEKWACYVTTHGWIEEKSIKYGTSPGNMEREKRSPLNVNLAPVNLLKAALTDIKGRSPFSSVHLWIGERVATWVAEEIEERVRGSQEKTRRCVAGCPLCGKKGAFETWNELEHFLCKELLCDPGCQMNEEEAQLIFANLYPDIRSNKKDPDKFHLRKLDKLDITEGTTDFCLFSPGIFKITSAGRTVRGNEVAGLSVISSCYRLWRQQTITSQQEFEANKVVIGEYNGSPIFLTGYDMWTASSPAAPSGLTYAPYHAVEGYAFNANPTSPMPCQFWSQEPTSGIDSRSDGAFVGDTATVDRPLFGGGFSVWIKPGYHGSLNEDIGEFEIAEEHLPGSGGGTIVTRCAYQFDRNAAGQITRKYIAASRTYVADIDAPPRSYPATVVYGASVLPNAVAILQETARNVYDDIASQMSDKVKTVDGGKVYIRFVPLAGEAENVAANLAPFVFSALSTGDFLGQDRSFYCYLKIEKNPITHVDYDTEQPVFGGWQDAGRLPIQGRLKVDLNTNKVDYSAGDGQYSGTVHLRNSVQANCPLKKCVFDGEPQYRQVTRDPEQPGGLQDIEYSPYPPMHSFNYSRTEYRVDVDLKKGRWYHVECKWGMGKDVMTISSLTVSSQEGTWVGQMAQDLIDGPLHVWKMNRPLHFGSRYYCRGCTIYQSIGTPPDGSAPQRYKNVKMKIKADIAGLGEEGSLKFAAISWAAFVPPGKDVEVKMKDSTGVSAQFSSNGAPQGSNALFGSDVYDGTSVLNDLLVDIAYKDLDVYSPNPFETPQLDMLYFYFLLEKPSLCHYHLD